MMRYLFIILALLWAENAAAHPHVFITAKAAFVVKEGKIIGIRQFWVYDPLFSNDLMLTFDSDRDKKLSAAEQQKMGGEILKNLKEFHYFTFIENGGKKIDNVTVAEFQAAAGARVAMSFLAILPEPIALKEQQLSLRTYDPSYYVEVMVDNKEPVLYENFGQNICHFTRDFDQQHRYFGGVIVPEKVNLVCP
ncbi:MAG: DUF1007 family protein [Dongiaceae bacterium]